MAGDNAELTFVRCPSCRSLVPAISTKCRMCGATFESGQAEEEKPRIPSGRVRQHTTSVTPGADGRTEGRGADPAPIKPPPISTPIPTAGFGLTSAVSDRGAPDVDDPLRGYVEEVDVGGTEKSAPTNGTGGHDSYVEPKMVGSVSPPPPQRSAPTPPPPPVSPQQPPSQVVVESGRGRPGGLSFGKPEVRDQKRPEAPPQRSAPEPRLEAREPAARSETQNKPQPSPRQDPPAQRHTPPSSPPRRDEKVENRQPQPERRSEPNRSASPKVQTGDGALVGWLVDYRDSKGQAVELREGQFFISRTRLKESDLIIDHATVSTPHAMVRASKQNGVEVQDLMSERGIKIRRHGSSSWQSAEERVKLGHGDKLQFGEIEYLIVLIPAE